MFAIRTHPSTLAFQPWHPNDVDEVAAFIKTQHDKHLEESDWLQLAIVERDTGDLIGDIGIHVKGDPAQVELGITIAPDRRRCGFGSEALLAVITHLFQVRKAHRIIGVADLHNAASIALLERCGLRREVVLRESSRMHGTWVDEIVFSILREEWVSG